MRGLLMKAGLVAILIAVIVIGYNGCGGKSSSGSSGDEPKLVLTGKIDSTGYQAFYTQPERFFDRFIPGFMNNAYAYGTGGTWVDKIIALQCEGGYLGEYSMQYAKEALVSSADGSFTLQLEKSMNWILMLVNSQASGEAKFVGYVALDDGAGNSLLQLPVATANTNSLDLGNLVSDTDTAISDNTAITASTFAMNVDQLIALAKTDDFFKAVKNFYVNYTGGVYWTLRPDFKWRGTYASLDDANGQDPNLYNYISYQFQLDTNSSDATVDKFCGTGGQTKRVMALYAPTGAQVSTNYSGVTYTDTFPISNTTVVTYTVDTDGYKRAGSPVNISAGEGPWGTSFSLGSTDLTGTIPAGAWLLKMGTDANPSLNPTIGLFDVSVASPITGTGKLNGFIPTLKVITGTDNIITSVEIKWYVINATGDGYDLVTDKTVLKYLVGSGDVYFSADNQTRYDSVPFNPATQSSVTPPRTWYYNDASKVEEADSFGIFYYSGGVGFFFEWFKP
ncbi:MAG: hypothetical protein AB1599_08345 [Planctomycetota bacterium]